MEGGDIWLAWVVNVMYSPMLGGGEVCHSRHEGWKNLLGSSPSHALTPDCSCLLGLHSCSQKLLWEQLTAVNSLLSLYTSTGARCEQQV